MRFVLSTPLLLAVGVLARLPPIKGLRGPEPDKPVPEGTTDQCTYYFNTAEGNDCQYVEDYWGLTHDQFVRWNPSVKEDCSGILPDHSYCVEVNYGGDITTSVTTTAEPTTTGSPIPSPTLDGTAPDCDAFHFVVKGDDCESITSRYGITMAQFMEWNTIVEEDCSGFWAEYYYCVSVIGHHASPTTTGADPTGTGKPTPSPVTEGVVDNCDAWHLVVKGDNCENIVSQYGINMGQFTTWNPSVESDCTGLWAQYYYCVSIEGREPTKTSSPSLTETGNPGPSPTLDGTHPDCDDYHLVVSGDNCADIVADYGITMAQFRQWNEAVGANCNGLWAEYYYCVSIKGHEPPPTTTVPPPTGPTAPAPTQTGIVKDCTDWYVVVSGDTCDKVVAKYGNLDLNLFRRWNPAIGANCAGLWLGNAYCVGTKTNPAKPPENPPPTGCQEDHPEPTQPGALCRCKKWHKMADGDSCWSLAQKYKVTETQIRNWNPGTNCNMWLGYNVCVGV